jgi:hypothetical protein|nr:MAG TPA: hypothetical protein [Caudoviricetes sp.]
MKVYRYEKPVPAFQYIAVEGVTEGSGATDNFATLEAEVAEAGGTALKVAGGAGTAPRVRVTLGSSGGTLGLGDAIVFEHGTARVMTFGAFNEAYVPEKDVSEGDGLEGRVTALEKTVETLQAALELLRGRKKQANEE